MLTGLEKSQKRNRFVSSVIFHVLLLIGALFMITPFWWMINTSLMENADYALPMPPRWLPWWSEEFISEKRLNTRISMTLPLDASSSIMMDATKDQLKIIDDNTDTSFTSPDLASGESMTVVIDSRAIRKMSTLTITFNTKSADFDSKKLAYTLQGHIISNLSGQTFAESIQQFKDMEHGSDEDAYRFIVPEEVTREHLEIYNAAVAAKLDAQEQSLFKEWVNRKLGPAYLKKLTMPVPGKEDATPITLEQIIYNKIRSVTYKGQDYPIVLVDASENKSIDYDALLTLFNFGNNPLPEAKDGVLKFDFTNREPVSKFRFTLTNKSALPIKIAIAEIDAKEVILPSFEYYNNILFKRSDIKTFGPLGQFGRYYVNSLIVAVISTISAIFLCSLGGYIFSKGRFPGKERLFFLLLTTMMVPAQVTIIPVYKMMESLGLLNSLFSLILPSLVNAYGIFLSKQFIDSIPDVLMESARIDGANELTIFWRIVLPNSKPVLATLGIIQFLASWNSFLNPLIMLNEKEWQTLPLGLMEFKNQFTTQWGSISAANAITLIPIIIVFIFLQKQVIKGIALSGVKE